MKRLNRWICFLLICVLMTLQVCEPFAAAQYQEGIIQEELVFDQPTAASGANSLSQLLEKAAVQEQIRLSGANVITDIKVDAGLAEVTYKSDREAVIVIAILSQDGMQLQTSAKVTAAASPQGSTIQVPLDAESIPGYFLVRAFLIDPETGCALGDPFTSNYYTEEIQKTLDKTAEDYANADGRVFYDPSTPENFVVTSQDTHLLEKEGQVNEIIQTGDGNWLIHNPDADALCMKAGDTFLQSRENYDLTAVKISSITHNQDGSLTVIPDQNVDLGDFFEVLAFDSTYSSPVITYGESAQSGQLQENAGEKAAVSAQSPADNTDGSKQSAKDEMEDSIFFNLETSSEYDDVKDEEKRSIKMEAGIRFEYGKSQTLDTTEYDEAIRGMDELISQKKPSDFGLPSEPSVDVTAKVGGKICVHLDCDLVIRRTASEQYIKVDMEGYVSVLETIGGEFTASYSLDMFKTTFIIPLGKIPIPIVLGIVPTVQLTADGEISCALKAGFDTNFTFTRTPSDPDGSFSTTKKEPILETAIAAKAGMKLSLSLAAFVSIGSEKFDKLDYTMEAAAEIEAAETIKDDLVDPEGERHDCLETGGKKGCFEGTVEFYIQPSVNLKIGFNKIPWKFEKITTEKQPWYMSIEYDECNWGPCPHHTYRVNLRASKRNNHMEINDTLIKISGIVGSEENWGTPQTLEEYVYTGKDSNTYTTYLPKGHYSLSASNEHYSGGAGCVVEDEPLDLEILMTEKEYKLTINAIDAATQKQLSDTLIDVTGKEDISGEEVSLKVKTGPDGKAYAYLHSGTYQVTANRKRTETELAKKGTGSALILWNDSILNISMEDLKYGTVNVTVVDLQGNPLPNISVMSFPEGWDDPNNSDDFATTDEYGKCILYTQVGEGSVRAAGSVGSEYIVTETNASIEEKEQDLRIVLAKEAYEVEITVVNATNQPVENVIVTAELSSGTGAKQTVATDVDGKAKFVLKDGTYTIKATTGYTEGSASLTVTGPGQSVQITLADIYNLTFPVKDSNGKPCVGYMVVLDGPSSKSGKTNSDGIVRFSHTKAGDYTVTVYDDGGNRIFSTKMNVPRDVQLDRTSADSVSENSSNASAAALEVPGTGEEQSGFEVDQEETGVNPEETGEDQEETREDPEETREDPEEGEVSEENGKDQLKAQDDIQDLLEDCTELEDEDTVIPADGDLEDLIDDLPEEGAIEETPFAGELVDEPLGEQSFSEESLSGFFDEPFEEDIICVSSDKTANAGNESLQTEARVLTVRNLVPGQFYVIASVVDKKAEDLLSDLNLSYITQVRSKQDGTIVLRYQSRRGYEASGAVIFGSPCIDISQAQVQIPQLTASGEVQTVNAKISLNDYTLKETEDYEISGDLAVKEEGTYELEFTGKGYFRGICRKEFYVTKASEQPHSDDPPTEAPKIPVSAKKGTVLNTSVGVRYQVIKDGKDPQVSINGLQKAAASLTIPSTVKIQGITYKVTAINANAFKNNKKLKKVVIGTNITKIGKNAFYKCKNLKSIKITTTSLTNAAVGKNAFKGIHAKAVFKVPRKVKKQYAKFLKKKGIGKKVKIK